MHVLSSGLTRPERNCSSLWHQKLNLRWNCGVFYLKIYQFIHAHKAILFHLYLSIVVCLYIYIVNLYLFCWGERSPHGKMVKVLNYSLKESKFELQLSLLHSLLDQYPGERYETPYHQNYELNSIMAVLLQEWLRY